MEYGSDGGGLRTRLPGHWAKKKCPSISTDFDSDTYLLRHFGVARSFSEC
jgi:hypothetical protein